jgi:predicted nucleic acid-binding protein
VKGIADSGFLVAFANANDKHHKWAAQLASGVTEPLLTCEAVIAETAFHLESATVALAMINEGLVVLRFNCQEHLVQLARLADRFADQKPDLADLCLVRMSELFPKHSVITIDRTDFQVYRRNKREAIPLLCPPER